MQKESYRPNIDIQESHQKRIFGELSNTEIKNIENQLKSFFIRRVFNFSLPEDLYQETMLRAINSSTSANTKDFVTIKNWLFAIAKSVVRDLVSRKSGMRYAEKNPIYFNDPNINLKNKISSPETLETRDSNLRELTNELLLFAESNVDREILFAHYIKEVPIPEIAKLHNCKPKAMRVRLFRARQRLLENYHKKYPEKSK